MYKLNAKETSVLSICGFFNGNFAADFFTIFFLKVVQRFAVEVIRASESLSVSFDFQS